MVVGVLVAGSLIAAGCRYTSDLRLPEHQAASSEVLWSDGSLLTTLHGVEDRQPVALGAMAPTFPTAVVAIEDQRFFDHDGVDARGMLRAFTRDVEAGNLDQGGSTITQQYVRAVMLGPEKELERKIREAVMAVQLEHRYSKRTILERYLNTIYFGSGAYGVQAAARHYFDKSAADLDLAQSALLAGLIRAPESYNPFVHPAEALARRNQVLDRIEHLHREPAETIASARAEPITLAPPTTGGRYPAPYFVEQVTKLILGNKAFGVTEDQRRRLLLEGGLRIHTTLDPKLQALAEQSAARVVSRPATDPAAAMVSIDPATGYVKAYVGGSDFWGTAAWAQLDLAGGGCQGDGKGCRQAGSAFKPFVLGAALDAGVPLTKTYDAPASLTIPQAGGQPPWLVNNYDGTGRGRMNLTEATVNSVNTVYAQLVMDIGPQPVVALAAKMGVHSPLAAVPSAALGSNGVTVLDMASAYDSLAGDGMHTEPVFVTKVTTADGTVLYQAPVQRTRVLSETTARTITGVLQQVVTRGTGVNAKIGRAVAGKTGTSDNWADAWFVGYTPELVTAVWVGFPDEERSMRPPTTRITVTGGSWPAQIWQLFEGGALAETPSVGFPAPEAPQSSSATTTTAPGAIRNPLLNAVGMSATDATRALRDAGFRVRLHSVPSRKIAAGTVVAQDPPAGREATTGMTVTISVVNGPPRSFVVPNALGQYADQAVRQLRDAGFEATIVVQSEPPPGSPDRAGRVWKQSPIAGALADEGSTVTLSVNPTTPP